MAALWLALYKSDKLLVVDDTRPCDLVVVLAGETQDRITQGMDMLQQGYGKSLMLDSPEGEEYGVASAELGRRFLETRLRDDQFRQCAFAGDSTIIEARAVRKCLQSLPQVHSVLLVTHDFHSRRALLSFEQMVPGIEFHVHAVRKPMLYQAHWWHSRENFKVWVESMTKMLWYLLVERWLFLR